MSKDLHGKVQEWLERTGFPLEMRVAEAARRADPLWVDQSRNYFDEGTGKVRETDVVAGWSERGESGGAYVYVVLECKAKPAPWVVFDDGQLPSDDAEMRLWWAVTRVAPSALGDLTPARLRSGAFTGDTLLRPSRVGLAAVEVTFSDRNSERNGAWDAVRAAVAAAHGIVSEFDAAQLQRSGAAIAAFPVVVTSGALFRAYLDDSGEVMVVEADRLEVTVRPGAQFDETRCLVVTEAALPQVFAEAKRTCRVIEAKV